MHILTLEVWFMARLEFGKFLTFASSQLEPCLMTAMKLRNHLASMLEFIGATSWMAPMRACWSFNVIRPGERVGWDTNDPC